MVSLLGTETLPPFVAKPKNDGKPLANLAQVARPPVHQVLPAISRPQYLTEFFFTPTAKFTVDM